MEEVSICVSDAWDNDRYVVDAMLIDDHLKMTVQIRHILDTPVVNS